MKVLTGHLTASNKKAIQAILNAGLTSGKVGNTTYFLEKDGEKTNVTFQKKDRGLGLIGENIRLSTYKATIKI